MSLSNAAASLVLGIKSDTALSHLVALSKGLETFKASLTEFNQVKAENPARNLPKDIQKTFTEAGQRVKTAGAGMADALLEGWRGREGHTIGGIRSSLSRTTDAVKAAVQAASAEVKALSAATVAANQNLMGKSGIGHRLLTGASSDDLSQLALLRTEYQRAAREAAATAAAVVNGAKARSGASKSAATDTNHLTEATQRLHTALRGVSGEAGVLWLTYSKYMGTMAASFAAAATVHQAIKKGSEFDYQSRFVAALSDNYSPDLYKKIQSDLRAVSKDSIADLNENARALRVLQQTGVDASVGIGLLKTSMQAAVLGETDMRTATEDLVSVLEVFDLHAEDPFTYTQNYKKAGDVIAFVSQQTKANFHQVAESFQGVVGVAQQYGVTLEQVSALTILLGKQGITGPRAGTYERSMIESVYSARSGKAQKIRDELGFDAFDKKTGQAKELSVALTELVGKLQQYDAKSQASMIQGLFPAWGAKAFRSVNNDLERFLELISESGDKTGLLAEQQARLAESISFQYQQLTADFSNLFTDSLDGTEGLTEAIKHLRDGLADPDFRGGVRDFVTASISLGNGLIWLVARFHDAAFAFKASGREIAAGALIAASAAKILYLSSGPGMVVTAAQGKNPFTEIANEKKQLAAEMKAFKKDLQKVVDEYENPTPRKWKNGEQDKISFDDPKLREKLAAYQATVKEAERIYGSNTKKIQQVKDLAYAALYGPPSDIPTKAGRKSYSPSDDAAAKKAESEAHREALAELDGIKKSWSAKIEAEATGFRQYKELIDQRVSLGILSQGGANRLLQEKEDATNRATEADVRGAQATLAAFAASHKLNGAETTRIKTEQDSLQIKLEGIQASNKHTVAMRLERIEGEKLAAANLIGKDILVMRNRETLARSKEAEAFSRRFDSDPVGDAGRTAYTGVMERALSESTKYQAALELQQRELKPYADLMAAGGHATEAQTLALAAQTEEVLKAKAAYAAFTEAVKTEAQASKDSAEARVVEAMTWQDGVQTAMAEYVRSVGTAAEQANRLMTNSFKGMEDALVNFIKTGKMDFKSLADSILEDLARMEAKKLMGGLMKMVDGEGGLLAGLFSKENNALGGVYSGPGISSYSNSIVNRPTVFPFASGIGLMGEKPGSPGEAIMPLTRMSGGDLGVKVAGGGGTSVNLQVNIVGAPSQPKVETRSNDSGGLTLDLIFEQVEGFLGRNLQRGEGLAPVLQRKYGLSAAAGSLR